MSDDEPEIDDTHEPEPVPPDEVLAPDDEDSPDESGGTVEADDEETEDRWEFWALASVILGVVMVASWIVVFLKLGIFSVQVHAMVIPTLGALTLGLLAWGLIRALFKPPAFRKSRTIAFVVLLCTGWVGNRPFIAPPLATDDWTSEQPYLLPFDGEWVTMAGGPHKSHNFNATTAAIRYAYDFTRVVDARKHELDGAKNDDYYCWGEPIYAPTSGTVVRVANDVVDNTPGEVAAGEVFGNHVVIQPSPSEFVFVWHLKKGSVPVAAGDEVSPATVIGECGNSGRSVEPHVKVHAQDRLDFPIALGLPIEFSDFDADGEPVDEGMPVGGSSFGALDGQRVSNNASRR